MYDVQVNVLLDHCTRCRAPMIIVNGKIVVPKGGSVRFTMNDEQVPVISIHNTGCTPLRGGE